jgi:ParB family transcriptional regulator, chromosome partitioning protein
MPELRSVDPRSLKPNPHNPRMTPAPAAMDEQLLASIRAIGIIQPPVVAEIDGNLVIKHGTRRVNAAIAAGLVPIDVIVADPDDGNGPMASLSENLVRAAMNSVDIWRGIDALEQKGWNEPAIADALALPLRTIKRLKLLAHLHPPMLEVIATGNMPSEDQLRTIAGASRDEQAQVWKKYHPKKGRELYWSEVARALAKRRIPFAAAKFGDDLAQAYGVVWEDDLFAPADEDGRYTTNLEGFFGAQQEWLQNHLPPHGTMVPQDDYGRPQLPKNAEQVYGKPGKGDLVGHYLDPYSGAVKTTVYRLVDKKKPAKPGNGATRAADPDMPEPKTRPLVTQAGFAMIGGCRTDALHQALRDHGLANDTLLALLVLAFSASNVEVRSPAEGYARPVRHDIAATLIKDGALTADTFAIAQAARAMLTQVLSCRENASNSGAVAVVAGGAIGADDCLPNFATDEFLPCLSRGEIEAAAKEAGLRVEVRVKDTRAALLAHYRNKRFVPPIAGFSLSEADIERLTVREADDNGFEETQGADIPREDRDGLGDGNAADDDEEIDAGIPDIVEGNIPEAG